MDIDISIGNELLTLKIDNPHKFDLKSVTNNIVEFGTKLGIDLTALKTDKLIVSMIRGVAGCEGGCPANAKNLVRQGFEDFDLSYTEGGILSAVHTFEDGNSLNLKIFPEFE